MAPISRTAISELHNKDSYGTQIPMKRTRSWPDIRRLEILPFVTDEMSSTAGDKWSNDETAKLVRASLSLKPNGQVPVSKRTRFNDTSDITATANIKRRYGDGVGSSYGGSDDSLTSLEVSVNGPMVSCILAFQLRELNLAGAEFGAALSKLLQNPVLRDRFSSFINDEERKGFITGLLSS